MLLSFAWLIIDFCNKYPMIFSCCWSLNLDMSLWLQVEQVKLLINGWSSAVCGSSCLKWGIGHSIYVELKWGPICLNCATYGLTERNKADRLWANQKPKCRTNQPNIRRKNCVGQAPVTDGSGIHKLNDMIWDPIIWIKKYKICDLTPQVDQAHQVTWSTGMGLTPESVIRLLYEFDSETWEVNQKFKLRYHFLVRWWETLSAKDYNSAIHLTCKLPKTFNAFEGEKKCGLLLHVLHFVTQFGQLELIIAENYRG